MQSSEIVARDAENESAPMGLLEIVGLFGGLTILLSGSGVVFERLTGISLIGLPCLMPFFYGAAGFAAARYGTIANGVWAGIMVAAIDTLAQMLLVMLNMSGTYDRVRSQIAEQAPAGLVGMIIVFVAIGTLVNVLIGGSLFGALGGAIAQARPFRPR